MQGMQGSGAFRLRHTLRAPSDICLAWSPDGHLLATVSSDRVQLWDAATGTLARELSGDLCLWVLSLAWSPDGRTLALGSRYGEVQLWDAERLELVRRIAVARGPGEEDDGIVDQLEWSADGTDLHVHCRSGPAGAVPAAARSPDGHLLAEGAPRGSVRLLELPSRRPLMELSGHADAVTSLSFSADGRFLATGSPDRRAQVWDCAAFRRVACLPLPRCGAGLCFHPRQTLLALPGEHYFHGVLCRTTDVWGLSEGAASPGSG